MDDFYKVRGVDGSDNSNNNTDSRRQTDKLPHNIESDAPSLLRVALSAGYINLAAQNNRRGGRSSSSAQHGNSHDSNGNSATNTATSTKTLKTSALSAASQDTSTINLIKAAQAIATASKSQYHGSSIDHNPTTLAALSSLGQFSHASNGVLVNIIDPSTPASGVVTYNQASPALLPPPNAIPPNTPPAASNKPGGLLFKTLKTHTEKPQPTSWEGTTTNLHLFDKLSTTFSRDYDSTLHSLSYSNPRTSTASNPSMGTIAHLPVRLGLTIQPILDPDRWHEGPYCHVYIAACANIDHYRAKVRPAIRAFVNQIEGSGIGIKDDSEHGGRGIAENGVPGATGTPVVSGKGGGNNSNKPTANEKALEKAGLSAGKTSAAGNFGSRYIIVFVPTGGLNTGNAAAGSSANNNSGGGGGFGGFRASRKGGGVVTSGSLGRDESLARSDNSIESNTTNQDAQSAAAAAAALPPGPIAHSSKEVKDLYMKFIKDFPKGRIVILGTLMDGIEDGGNNSHIASMSPLKNQEWKAFLHNLGGAIVDGFGDRVKRYDEELRRLDSKRAAFVRKMSGENHASNDEEAKGFDLSHFFLVKESLAFTYEQMQMPDEAKLQYEELEAFLPEEAWRQLAQAGSDETDSHWDDNLALTGDTNEFRRYVKSSGRDLHGVSRLVPQYMYVRQMRLMFQMGAAVDVLTRSKDFLAQEYRNRLSDVATEFNRRWKSELESVGIDSSSDKVLARQETLKRDKCMREAEVEAWALSSSWDIKCASEHYFGFTVLSEPNNAENEASNLSAASNADERDAARCLAELLEFAILRLTRMGDLSLGDEGRKANPIRRATSVRPEDTKRPWEPWKELQKRRELKQPLITQTNNRGDPASTTWELDLPGSVSSWLKHAFANKSRYEETYLELAESAITFNRLAGRFRFASRLEDNRAEVLISRGDFESAASVLANNAGACTRDQWNRAAYWRLFRLASCQRMSGDVLAYLETLTQSFNPRLASVAPQKTSSLFQSDLEAIIGDAAVADPVRQGTYENDRELMNSTHKILI